jgi:3-oxoacyl-[acyl-carrier protein] reductase
LAQTLSQDGVSVETTQFDVADEVTTRRAIEQLLRCGPIQIVVSNAGIHSDAPLAGMTAAQWRSVIDVSLNGFYNVCQPLLLPMIGTRWGRVIAVSSISGLLGNRGQANYAAAKSGLHGAVRSLSLEVASRGITANAVAPGVIETNITDGKFDAETIRRMIPARRKGRPEEVAALVSFLASAEAAYISGQVISINGDMC